MIKIQYSSSASTAKLKGQDIPHHFSIEQTKQKETSQLSLLSLFFPSFTYCAKAEPSQVLAVGLQLSYNNLFACFACLPQALVCTQVARQ